MIGTLLTIGAGIIAGIITWVIAEKRIAIENITHERAKWRGQVRKISSRINKAIILNADTGSFNILRCEFALLINPYKDTEKNPYFNEDEAILKCISAAEEGKEESHATEFTIRVSLLLKHDWDRAKFEALALWDKFYFQRCKEPRRLRYEEYLKMKKSNALWY
jgi:hypothetical protein